MGFQKDRFGHKAYTYSPDPSLDKVIERSPDKLPSSSDAWYVFSGPIQTYFLEVRGLGVLMMRCRGGFEDGKIRFEGVTLVTNEQIQFD